jgi:hypothetical protein
MGRPFVSCGQTGTLARGRINLATSSSRRASFVFLVCSILCCGNGWKIAATPQSMNRRCKRLLFDSCRGCGSVPCHGRARSYFDVSRPTASVRSDILVFHTYIRNGVSATLSALRRAVILRGCTESGEDYHDEGTARHLRGLRRDSFMQSCYRQRRELEGLRICALR